jgi:hypothetical protein
MVKAGAHLAAGAIAAALLLTGAGGAVAFADTPADSTASENSNSTAPDSSAAPAEHSVKAEHPVDNNTLSSSENARSPGDQADNESNGGDAKDSAREEPGDEQIDEKQPDEKQPEEKQPDHDPGASNCSGGSASDCPGGKTITRVPLRPEAPPPVDLAPLPEAPLAPAPETPPPADLPPVIPATPVDPDTVDAGAGEAGHRPGGNEPPVLTAPFLIAPAPLPPVHILGASIAPLWPLVGRTVDPAPQWAGEPSPQLLRASSDQRQLHESSLTNFGLTARGQTPYRTGYAEYSSRPLAQTAAGALPGLAGLVIMTASGICLGYRQANMAQQLRPAGVDRFLS